MRWWSTVSYRNSVLNVNLLRRVFDMSLKGYKQLDYLQGGDTGSMCDNLDMQVLKRAKAFKFLWNAGTMHKVLQVQDRIEYTYLRSKICLDFHERFNRKHERFNRKHERFNTVSNTSLWNRDSASLYRTSIKHPFVILRAFAVRASRSIAAPWSIEYTTYRPSTFMSASGDVVFREPRMPLWFRIQTNLEPPQGKTAPLSLFAASLGAAAHRIYYSDASASRSIKRTPSRKPLRYTYLQMYRVRLPAVGISVIGSLRAGAQSRREDEARGIVSR
ncbi:hypothetical protein C8R43DRAFT_1241626 [Mycena crocata]|nr:hypothetical protein C8R43DRAFT_1241626 [Mycena crocata]